MYFSPPNGSTLLDAKFGSREPVFFGRARLDPLTSPQPLALTDVASSGFACAGASTSHRQWPQQVSFGSVVVGILGNGHQLDRIYSTWLPELSQGHVYLMVDACEHATTSLSMHRRAQSDVKAHAARDGPAIQLVHLTPTISACRCQKQIIAPRPTARHGRTASRRRGIASLSARHSPLRARAGCGCHGSTEPTHFGYNDYAICPKSFGYHAQAKVAHLALAHAFGMAQRDATTSAIRTPAPLFPCAFARVASV